MAEWPGFIEWWDEPDDNARVYHHVGCDEGLKPWIAPLDDSGKPTAKDMECANCCLIRRLKQRGCGMPSDRPL